MKIDINRIPAEGSTFEENIDPLTLDLETEIIEFSGPIKIKAEVSKITNAVTVDINFSALINTICSRCLCQFANDIRKRFKLNYQADRIKPIIDMDVDIREEIIMDYPMKSLCKPDCKGLCSKCGVNLNKEECKCVS